MCFVCKCMYAGAHSISASTFNTLCCVVLVQFWIFFFGNPFERDVHKMYRRHENRPFDKSDINCAQLTRYLDCWLHLKWNSVVTSQRHQTNEIETNSQKKNVGKREWILESAQTDPKRNVRKTMRNDSMALFLWKKNDRKSAHEGSDC